MNALDIVANQYLATIAQLSARIAQAALELTQAQERIAELEKAAQTKPDLKVVDNEAPAAD